MMSSLGTFSDEELLSLLRDEKYHAFTEIYQRYWKKMLLIAWNHAKDKTAAEDVVHEVFMSLWEKKGELDIKNIPAYLCTAIKFSIFKNYQREIRRNELAKQNYNYQAVVDEEEKLDALFLQEYINNIVEELPEKCKLVFKYSRELGMKNIEIAEKLQITEKGVEANLTRALKVIRGGLKNSGVILLLAHQVYKDLF